MKSHVTHVYDESLVYRKNSKGHESLQDFAELYKKYIFKVLSSCFH